MCFCIGTQYEWCIFMEVYMFTICGCIYIHMHICIITLVFFSFNLLAWGLGDCSLKCGKKKYIYKKKILKA